MKDMKKIVLILVTFYCMSSSCSFLETEPADFVAKEYYFNNETELNYALTGVYDILGNNDVITNLIGVCNTMDELYATNGGYTPFDYEANSPVPQTLWQYFYQGVERANIFLANVDKAEVDEEKRNIMKGEARFLRAFYYFWLVQNFGAVPLMTSPTASVVDVYFPRTPADEVYNFIIKEMEEAERLVPDITAYSHAGKITKSAVQGILARVCLYKAGFPNNDTSKYADALKWAERVINSGFHDLNPDYSQVFINHIQNIYDTKESIWEIEFYTSGVGDPYNETSNLGANNGINQTNNAYGASYGQFSVQQKLYVKYEDTDTRRDWAIAPYSYQGNNTQIKVYYTDQQIYVRRIGKFRREYELITNKQGSNTGTNFPLLRYADVLLMAAEAENEVNGPTTKAYQYLNEVRGRANASVITGLENKEDLRKVIQDERSRELCFEGYRRLDLIRWNTLVSTMQELLVYVNATAPTAQLHANRPASRATDKLNYFPIPLREMTLNNLLTQNPGY